MAIEAIILEITGFPKRFEVSGGGAHPLGGAPLGAGVGIAGESIQNDITTITLLLSDFAYRTTPTDATRPNIFTEARMMRRADIEQSSPISQGSSRRSQNTTGDFEFADDDGYLRGISDDYSFDGRAATVYKVTIGQPWSTAEVISNAVVRSLTRSKNKLRVNLDDAASALDQPLVPRVYTGTGGRNGDNSLTGQSPPLGYGYVNQAKPLLEDPAIYLYRVSDYPIEEIISVEERGLAFTLDADVANYSLLQAKADTLSAGQYATCLADGSLVIKFAGGSPLNSEAIRVTFKGDKSDGTYTEDPGTILNNIMQYSMGIATSNIDSVSLAALPSHDISYYFSGGTSPTGADAFNTIMNSIYGTFGSVTTTKIGAVIYRPPSDVITPAGEIVEGQIFSVENTEAPQNAVYSQGVSYNKNWNPLTEDQLAVGSLDAGQIEARKRLYEAVYTITNGNIKASDLSAIVGAQINSVVENQSGAEDVAARFMGVWGVEAKSFEIDADFSTTQFNRGDVVTITHRDLGEKSGNKFLIFSRRLQISKRKVLLTVIG